MGVSDIEKRRQEDRRRQSTLMVLAGRNKKGKKGARGHKGVAARLKAGEQRIKLVLPVVLVIVLAMLLVPYVTLPPKTYNVGDVALGDVKATEDFLVVDEASTLAKREEAVTKLLPVYDFDLKSRSIAPEQGVEIFERYPFRRIADALQADQGIPATAKDDRIATEPGG